MTFLMHAGYGAMFALALAAVAASTLGIRWRRALAAGKLLVLGGVAVGVVGISARWYVSGHPPIFGTFENTYLLAWSLLAAGGTASVLSARLSRVWRWAVPWALAALLYGSQFRSEAVPLTISEQSLWVEVHVVFAWLALVALLGSTTIAAVRLAGGTPLGMQGDEVDRLATDLLMIGFAAFSAMLATGAWYSYVLFGTFWQWEIVETLSLLTWLGFGIVIHGRLFYRWSGRRLDVAILLVLPVLVGSYFIWSVFPDTFHFFDVPLIKPY